MKDLVSVSKTKIGKEVVQAVDARELHKFLGVKTEFKDWIARRVKEC